MKSLLAVLIALLVNLLPAPATADGYAQMFDQLDPAQWQAADVGITVAMPDGRSVWLWGDTFSEGRFVHSSAIIQTGSLLTVSHQGAQLLPDDGERYY